MTLITVLASFIVVVTFAYWSFGRRLVHIFQLSDQRTTPAHLKNDGLDFVPTSRFYLFAQHFSAIAAAGPIAGPIAACLTFGWLPCLLWIGLGVVVIGAVHDFASLAISVRHGASSVAEIAREHLGSKAGRAMMLFIWLALMYVIVAFANITAGSFASAPEELQGVAVKFNPGGAVAFASVAYLLLSMILGLVQRFLNPPMWLVTVIFVPLTFFAAWMGTWYSDVFVFTTSQWGFAIILYCGIASMMPVWLLLQPRGYLGGFVLYFSLAVGVLGLLFGASEIHQPAFKGWDVGTPTGLLFPFLFVTIACGACSGFHGLVCSGTTSKQIDKESHVHAIGYGAMLAEGFVALIALAIVMIATPEEVAGLKPGTIYGNGLGKFIAMFIGQDHLAFATTLGAMAFSTFVFDTLDVSARLGRYLVQEVIPFKDILGAVAGTALTLAPPLAIIAMAQEGEWGKFWTLFGASNQLLAALTLLTISVWLAKTRKPYWYTLAPSFFVLLITFSALGKIVWDSFAVSERTGATVLNGMISGVLLLLAGYFSYLSLRAVFRGESRAV
jgi:carbon starvation protein